MAFKTMSGVAFPLDVYKEFHAARKALSLSWRQYLILSGKFIAQNLEKPYIIEAADYVRTAYPSTPGPKRKVADEVRAE